MWAYKGLTFVLMLTGWLVLPLQFVTTFVLGILCSLTFDLPLFPLSLIWIVCFLGPLLGLSWLWERIPLLRIPLAVIGIPLAVVANTYVALVPSLGELDSRISKFLLAESWPYSLDLWRLVRNKSFPDSPGATNLRLILADFCRCPPWRHFLQSLGVADPPVSLQRGETDSVTGE